MAVLRGPLELVTCLFLPCTVRAEMCSKGVLGPVIGRKARPSANGLRELLPPYPRTLQMLRG